VNIWKYVKDNPKTIIKNFETFGKMFKPLSKENKNNKCKEIIKKFDHMKYDIKRASLYMLMKYCSFMGNIMKNNKYFFNGLEMNIYVDNYPFLKEANYTNLLNVADYLNDTKGKIYNKDYKEILEKAKKGDFVFLDPPYLEKHNYNFNYNKDEIINELFIKNLLKELKKLDKRGVNWMMTQANTTQIRKIFKDYPIKIFKVYRASKKTHVNELIIMNY
jgi:DNA adenine methylase